MVSIQELRNIALSYPDTTEEPHFEKTSFRVKKKIFASYDAKNYLACVKLSAIDQDVFCTMSKGIIYPVPNKWGLQGWTYIDLSNIDLDIFNDVLKTSYEEVASKRK